MYAVVAYNVYMTLVNESSQIFVSVMWPEDRAAAATVAVSLTRRVDTSDYIGRSAGVTVMMTWSWEVGRSELSSIKFNKI